jgi:PAS domain S-box-containing protein
MNNKDPEARLKELEIEMNDLTKLDLDVSLHNELSFRQAIENAIPSGIAVVDSKGRQVYVNPSFCKMIGRDEYELLGKEPPYLYWAEQDLANINDAFQKTIQNKAPREGFDLLFSHKSGKLIPVNVVISQFATQDGTFWLANIFEITERKKIEEALKKSQLLLMSSIESQKSAIIFSIDRDYNYLYFNKAHADAMKFAYNADIHPGMNFLDFISSDDDGKLLKENIDDSLRGESHSIIQTFGDTNIANYEVFFNPVVNEKDEIIGCTCLARNITERVQAEQALKESETKFREIINQINDAIVVFDGQGKIVIWNNGAEQLCGLRDHEILDRSIVDVQYQLTPPAQKDKTLIEKAINGILTMQTPDRFNQIIDSEIITSDTRQIKNIQSTVFPIKLQGYHLFCTVIRDTTEIKRYEKELLRISDDKDKFYSIIAQYLYNPFNLFHNFTKMMAEELDTLSIREIQKMVSTMSKSATNLYSLLDNMLQYTKVNQGNISFKPQKANLNKISHEAVSILKPISEEKNITFNHIIADDIDAYADIFMLKTILRNLVANAIKYTPNDGQITISAHQTASEVTISVLDNGTGLTPGYIKKLFDISQIHSALGETEEKGTTLGLLLCKEFVEKHGGSIWVESEKGIGSRFKFTLPLFSEQNDQRALNSQSL